MSAPFFGCELLLKGLEGEISNSQDVLFCFAHLVLVANGFRCVGLGDSELLDGNETKTESLPQGWSVTYTVRYVSQGRLYHMRGTNVNDALMINLIRVQERPVSVLQLPEFEVAQMAGPLEQVIPNYEELANNIKKQLIDKIAISAKFKDVASQTDMEQNYRIFPISPSSDKMPRFGFEPDDREVLDEQTRPDLQCGGRLLYVPPPVHEFRPPGLILSPGLVPPDARFDLLRPPGADDDSLQNRRLSGDDLPPPGFDDM